MMKLRSRKVTDLPKILCLEPGKSQLQSQWIVEYFLIINSVLNVALVCVVILGIHVKYALFSYVSEKNIMNKLTRCGIS